METAKPQTIPVAPVAIPVGMPSPAQIIYAQRQYSFPNQSAAATSGSGAGYKVSANTTYLNYSPSSSCSSPSVTDSMPVRYVQQQQQNTTSSVVASSSTFHNNVSSSAASSSAPISSIVYNDTTTVNHRPSLLARVERNDSGGGGSSSSNAIYDYMTPKRAFTGYLSGTGHRVQTRPPVSLEIEEDVQDFQENSNFDDYENWSERYRAGTNLLYTPTRKPFKLRNKRPDSYIERFSNFEITPPVKRYKLNETYRAIDTSQSLRDTTVIHGSRSSSGVYKPKVEAISPTLPNSPPPPTQLDSASESKTDDSSTTAAAVEKLPTCPHEITSELVKTHQAIQSILSEITTLNDKQDEKPKIIIDESEEEQFVPHSTKLAYDIYRCNWKKINEWYEMLAKCGPVTNNPLYNQAYDTHIYHTNKDKHLLFRPYLRNLIKQEKSEKDLRNQFISTSYHKLQSQWKADVERYENSQKRKMRECKNREIFEKLFPELRKQREDKERISRQGTRVKTEADIEEIMDGIQEQELEDKKMRSYAAVPPLMLDITERRYGFLNVNGLTLDVYKQYKEKQYRNTWSQSEKDAFREKFLAHPKQFGVISAFIEKKTAADCVQYYYRSKKMENYKRLLRKSRQRPRTRNLHSKSNGANNGIDIFNSAPGVTTRLQREQLQLAKLEQPQNLSTSADPENSNDAAAVGDGSGFSGVTTIAAAVSNASPPTPPAPSESTVSDSSPSCLIISNNNNNHNNNSQTNDSSSNKDIDVADNNNKILQQSNTAESVNITCTTTTTTITTTIPTTTLNTTTTVGIGGAGSTPEDNAISNSSPTNNSNTVQSELKLDIRKKEQKPDQGNQRGCGANMVDDLSEEENAAANNMSGGAEKTLYPCAICKTDLSASRALPKSHAHQYGLTEDQVLPGARVCNLCRCKAVRSRYVQCPIPVCPNAKGNRVKRLRPLPGKWQELPTHIRQTVISEFQIPNNVLKCCSACFNRIQRRLICLGATTTANTGDGSVSDDSGNNSNGNLSSAALKWTDEETEALKRGIVEHGVKWADVSQVVGHSKTQHQCKNFYFNFRKKLGLDVALQEYNKSHGNEERKPTLSSDEESSSAPSSCDDLDSDTASASSPINPNSLDGNASVGLLTVTESRSEHQTNSSSNNYYNHSNSNTGGDNGSNNLSSSSLINNNNNNNNNCENEKPSQQSNSGGGSSVMTSVIRKTSTASSLSEHESAELSLISTSSNNQAAAAATGAVVGTSDSGLPSVMFGAATNAAIGSPRARKRTGTSSSTISCNRDDYDSSATETADEGVGECITDDNELSTTTRSTTTPPPVMNRSHHQQLGISNNNNQSTVILSTTSQQQLLASGVTSGGGGNGETVLTSDLTFKDLMLGVIEMQLKKHPHQSPSSLPCSSESPTISSILKPEGGGLNNGSDSGHSIKQLQENSTFASISVSSSKAHKDGLVVIQASQQHQQQPQSEQQLLLTTTDMEKECEPVTLDLSLKKPRSNSPQYNHHPLSNVIHQHVSKTPPTTGSSLISISSSAHSPHVYKYSHLESQQYYHQVSAPQQLNSSMKLPAAKSVAVSVLTSTANNSSPIGLQQHHQKPSSAGGGNIMYSSQTRDGPGARYDSPVLRQMTTPPAHSPVQGKESGSGSITQGTPVQQRSTTATVTEYYSDPSSSAAIVKRNTVGGTTTLRPSGGAAFYPTSRPLSYSVEQRQIIMNDYLTSQQISSSSSSSGGSASSSNPGSPMVRTSPAEKPPSSYYYPARQGVIQRHNTNATAANGNNSKSSTYPAVGHEALSSLVDVAVRQPNLPIPPSRSPVTNVTTTNDDSKHQLRHIQETFAARDALPQDRFISREQDRYIHHPQMIQQQHEQQLRENHLQREREREQQSQHEHQMQQQHFREQHIQQMQQKFREERAREQLKHHLNSQQQQQIQIRENHLQQQEYRPPSSSSSASSNSNTGSRVIQEMHARVLSPNVSSPLYPAHSRIISSSSEPSESRQSSVSHSMNNNNNNNYHRQSPVNIISKQELCSSSSSAGSSRDNRIAAARQVTAGVGGGGESNSTLTAASLIDAIITHQINQANDIAPQTTPPSSANSSHIAVQRPADKLFQVFPEPNGKMSPLKLTNRTSPDMKTAQATCVISQHPQRASPISSQSVQQFPDNSTDVSRNVAPSAAGTHSSQIYLEPQSWKLRRALQQKELEQNERNIVRVGAGSQMPLSPRQRYMISDQPPVPISALDYVKNKIVEVMRTSDSDGTKSSSSSSSAAAEVEENGESTAAAAVHRYSPAASYAYPYSALTINSQVPVSVSNKTCVTPKPVDIPESSPLLSSQYEPLSDED